jgi:hypothetical protein
MIKTLLGTFCVVLGLTSSALAQNVPSVGVSSGSSIINISGFSETSTDFWGSYESLDVSVKAAGAGSGTFPGIGQGLVNNPNLNQGALTLGGLGGFQVIVEEGGYSGRSFTRQDFTGQSVTSQTNF